MIPLHKYPNTFLGQLKLSSGAFISLVDVTTLWVELTCGKFNWIGMIWKGTCLNKRSNSWKCISEQNPSLEVKQTACRGQKQDWVKAQIRGRVQKTILQHWRVSCSMQHVTLNGRYLEQPGLFLELSSWPNWEIDGEGLWLEGWPRKLMVTRLVELHDHVCKSEKPKEGQTLQHSTDLGFMAVWPNSILSTVKTDEDTLGIYKKAPKGPSDSEKQDYLVWWTSIPSIMFEGNQLCSLPSEYHPKSKVCW